MNAQIKAFYKSTTNTLYVFAYNCVLHQGGLYASAYSSGDSGRADSMNVPEPPTSNSARYFVVGVLGVALLLGFYFVQLNAKVDRQREETAERLALCLHLERVAGVAASRNIELSETCKQLSKQLLKTVAPE